MENAQGTLKREPLNLNLWVTDKAKLRDIVEHLQQNGDPDANMTNVIVNWIRTNHKRLKL